MRILFVCNQNQHRSKTAAEMFKPLFETRSAGLYNEQPLTEATLSWADVVVVMEDHQRSEIAHRFPHLYMQKRILSLDIPDVYHYNQPSLLSLLQSRLHGLL